MTQKKSPPKPESLFKQDRFTIPELIERWQCTENDIRRAIIDGQLVPSFRLVNSAPKVKFQKETTEGETYWVPKIAHFDEDKKPKLFDIYGYYYLLHPEFITTTFSALDCNFFYFSKDRNHAQGTAEKNICFSLMDSKQLKDGISMDQVLKDGMVLLEEVERVELERTGHVNNTHASLETPLRTHERNILLGIIGALCKEASLDYKRSSKTAGVIESMLAKLGAKVAESTIRGHLNKIENALESLSK